MNCIPGDLAIFVRSFAGNEGKIVRCVRLATHAEKVFFNFVLWPDIWLLESKVATDGGPMVPLAVDSCLRPIRDSGEDATDETLFWLPVPSVETVDA